MNELLSEIKKSDSFIKGSAIATYDGVSHCHSELHEMDEDYIGAMSAAIFAASKKGVAQLIGGKIKQIIIEGEEGHVLITSPSDELLLTTIAHAGANVQAILQQMSLVKGRISADGLVLGQ
jgi:predicted regulator of Ras-like GTPase activity (Roadblock/LC7/MglB family)